MHGENNIKIYCKCSNVLISHSDIFTAIKTLSFATCPLGRHNPRGTQFSILSQHNTKLVTARDGLTTDPSDSKRLLLRN
jgi:hypothetical protein